MRFSFFKTPKHREFEYLPRYFDPEKEALEAVKKKANGRYGYSGNIDFKKEAGRRRQMQRQSSVRILWIILVLAFLTWWIFS